MKISVYFILFSFFIFNATEAQKPAAQKPAAKKQAVPASPISLKQMAASIAKLYAMIRDPQVSGTGITGQLLYTAPDYKTLYSPLYPIAGAEYAHIEKQSVFRKNSDYVRWEYNCVVAKVRGGTETAMMEKIKSTLDSSIAAMSICNGSNCIWAKEPYYSKNNAAADSVGFSIVYFKKTETTAAAAIDSIIRLYEPGLMRSSTLRSALAQFDKAAAFERLQGHPDIVPAITKLLKAMYAANRDDAFTFFLESELDTEIIVAAKNNLDPAARRDIEARARNIVTEFNRQRDSVFHAARYPGQANPYATAATGSGTQTAGAPNICEQNKKNQKFAVGSELSSQSKDYWNSSNPSYFVAGYDCNTNQYEVLRMVYVAPRKTFFKSEANIPRNDCTSSMYSAEAMSSSFTSAGSRKKLCTVCRGTGLGTITQVRTAGGWKDEGYNVKSYSTERVIASWEERSSCAKCGGSGHLN